MYEAKPSIFRSDKTRNVCFKNDRSSKFFGEVIFKKIRKNTCKSRKSNFKVYVNQGKSLSHIKIRHACDFSLCFTDELLMRF